MFGLELRALVGICIWHTDGPELRSGSISDLSFLLMCTLGGNSDNSSVPVCHLMGDLSGLLNLAWFNPGRGRPSGNELADVRIAPINKIKKHKEMYYCALWVLVMQG